MIRYFDDHVQEVSSCMLANLPYGVSINQVAEQGLRKLLVGTPLATTAINLEEWRVLYVHPTGKQCDVLEPDTLLRDCDVVRRGNPLYHCLRIERICEVIPPGMPALDGTGQQMVKTVCYHAERSNTTIPYGHPFFLPVYSTDTVPAIKQRIKDKLKVPEREFKQWRLGKVAVTDHHSQLFETQLGSRYITSL